MADGDHIKNRFYLRDVVSRVFALATWVAGWVAGWYCIKTAKSIWTFSTIWKPHHYSFLWPLRRYTIPSSGALNTRRVGKLAIFVRFSTDIAIYLGNGAISADGYNGTLIGSHGRRIECYNFRWLGFQGRVRHMNDVKSNISKTVQIVNSTTHNYRPPKI